MHDIFFCGFLALFHLFFCVGVLYIHDMMHNSPFSHPLFSSHAYTQHTTHPHTNAITIATTMLLPPLLTHLPPKRRPLTMSPSSPHLLPTSLSPSHTTACINIHLTSSHLPLVITGIASASVGIAVLPVDVASAIIPPINITVTVCAVRVDPLAVVSGRAVGAVV